MYSKRFIQNNMEDLKSLELQKEIIQEKINNKQRMFKEYMVANNIEELVGENGEKIIFKDILGKRFDSSAFKKTYGYLYEMYCVATTNKRFKFTY